MEKRTGLITNGLIWFGAAISIAEILTGTYFAPLGFWGGFKAVLLGHLIGGILMGAIAYISAKERVSAMEAVKITFGNKGGLLFALLNVLQLVGWTCIMIYDGALAAQEAFAISTAVWCAVIGGLICLWLILGVTHLGPFHKIAMAALFLLSILLCVVIARAPHTTALPISEMMTFGAAVELSAAMPLSWLPVIGDYTSQAEKPLKASLVSVIVYNLASVWMYMIGLAAALFTGQTDFVKIMTSAGLGIAALIIILFSTVTTTFLDAFSAGVSFKSIMNKVSIKTVALITTVVGTIIAMVWTPDDITPFLYTIGAVFAPMTAVMLADWYINKSPDRGKEYSIIHLLCWLGGFILYRYVGSREFTLGITTLVVVCVLLVTAAINAIRKIMP